MTYSVGYSKGVRTLCWTAGAIAFALALSGRQLLQAQQARPARQVANGRRVSEYEVVPRMAQNTAPPPNAWDLIKSLTGSTGAAPPNAETLPLPPSYTPQAPPVQHVIPFAKPDPNAEIEFAEQDGLISLTVHDGSLRHTVAMIAEAQGLNIVFSAPADIGITASLESVPWQQALDSLLAASGYTWSSSDGIIFVSSLETANFMPPGAGGRHTRIFELDFASAVDVDQAAKGLLSPGGDSWVLESSSTDNRRSREAIVVFDYPTHLRRIEDYICQIDQPPRQVLIEANILQVDLEDDCKHGVNFDALATFRNNEVDFRTIGFANPSATSAFFIEATGAALTSLVELLKSTTDAKTLASPKLLVVSGQEARIQIGEQLGFRVTTTTQTSSLESIEFLDVGVVLTVEPRITRDGRVLMRVKPEVSTGQVDPNTGLPAEETTEVETDILLDNEQGMVIGGLIQEQDSIVQNKIPWIGDLPYVGVLFQKRQAIKTRSEIIVTLIPHVQPYPSDLAYQNAHDVMRSRERLTKGPLDKIYRPYEPRLPDSITNPQAPCIARHFHHSPAVHCSPAVPCDPQLIPLPPVNGQPIHTPSPSIPSQQLPTVPMLQSRRPIQAFN